MTTSTEGERITRLETEVNHVTTKADVAAVRTGVETLSTDMAHMQTSIIKWMTCLAIGIALSVGLSIADLLVTVLASEPSTS